MDPARPLLLGLLIAAGCASWPEVQPAPLEPSLVAGFEPVPTEAPRCDSAPSVAQVGTAVVVTDACAPVVALFRRDVVSDGPSVYLGACTVPCIDAHAEPGRIYAYTTAALHLDSTSCGPPSTEAYLEVAAAAR